MIAKALLELHSREFAWGVSDCVQFAADAVLHYSGVRPEIPQYSSEIEAKRVIIAAGGLEAMVTQALGEPIHIRDAEVGDIVLTAFRDSGQMLGVADPRRFWIKAQGGFAPIDLELAIKVWPCRRR